MGEPRPVWIAGHPLLLLVSLLSLNLPIYSGGLGVLAASFEGIKRPRLRLSLWLHYAQGFFRTIQRVGGGSLESCWISKPARPAPFW